MIAQDKKVVYQVYDHRDGSKVGPACKTRAGARRKVDRLDNEYGGYRYYYKPEEVKA